MALLVNVIRWMFLVLPVHRRMKHFTNILPYSAEHMDTFTCITNQCEGKQSNSNDETCAWTFTHTYPEKYYFHTWSIQVQSDANLEKRIWTVWSYKRGKWMALTAQLHQNHHYLYTQIHTHPHTHTNHLTI